MEQTQTTERKCEHAQDYDNGLLDGRLNICNLDGRGICDCQRHIWQGKPFCAIPLNQENWYDGKKPRFKIWYKEGEGK